MSKLEDRQLDISDKLLQMGQALNLEGLKKNDYTIAQAGTLLSFISGVILDEEDVYMFSLLCEMFAAKKMLESTQNKGDGKTMNKDILEDLIKKNIKPKRGRGKKGDN